MQDVLDSVKGQLSLFAPNRFVTRDFIEFEHHSDKKRRNGVFTILMGGESGYANYRGREAELGKTNVSIIGQFELIDGSGGLLVENEEHRMVNEFKNFAQSQLPSPIDGLLLLNVKYSMQVDRPYGWVISTWTIE